MKKKIKKNRLKIFIALSLMITTIFGVMFATNTFAYNGNSNTISSTLSNPTNFSTSTILNSSTINTDNYIDVRVNNNSGYITYITFDINDTSLNNHNLQYGNYTLLINWCRITQNGISTSTSTGQTISVFPNNNNVNGVAAYTYPNNYITYGSKQFKTSTIDIGGSNSFNIITGQITIGYRGTQNQATDTSWQGLRIYNVDLVQSSEIYTKSYIDTYYGPLEEQYNQLLVDYNNLELDYTELDNQYNSLAYNYELLDSAYNELEENYNSISSLNDNGIWNNIYELKIYYLKNGSSSTSTFTKQELIDNNYLLNSTLRLSDIAHFINADNFSYRFNIIFTNLNMPNYTKNIDINLITNTAWAHSIDFKIAKYNSDGSTSSPTIIYMSASADDIISNSYNINYNWLYFQEVEGYNIQAFYNTYNVFTRIVFDYDANITILDDDIVYLKSNNSTYLMGYQTGQYDSDIKNTNYYEPIISSLNDNINNLNNDIDTLQQQIRTLQEGYTMNDLMWTIGSVPFESFKHIWNVNFLGINIADFILGLITTFIGLYIVKKFFL